MKKLSIKEQKICDCILNRVKFHAPIVFDSKVDRNVLLNAGVDPEKPIFKFEKTLSKHVFRALVCASNLEEFNIVMPRSCAMNIPQKRLNRIRNLVLYSPENCSLSFFEMVNKLNINYSASTNYDMKFSEKFFKINGRVVNVIYDDFSLSKTMYFGDCLVEYHEFVLNGANYFLKFKNFGDNIFPLEIELNIPLERGYYYFKHERKNIQIENLSTHEILNLNFNSRGAKFCFSEVEGLENSTFSCINLKAKINPKNTDFLFFNFGKDVFSMKNLRSASTFFEVSKKKCYEIFDLKIASKNPKFDQFFNVTMPQKIWLGWLDCKPNFLIEEKYISCRKLFLKDGKNFDFQRFDELSLREIGIFNGEYYKRIFVVNGAEKFLKVGKTCFYNINTITKKSLKTHEEICICFGEKPKKYV